jgi:hypothetical protein
LIAATTSARQSPTYNIVGALEQTAITQVTTRNKMTFIASVQFGSFSIFLAIWAARPELQSSL